jgi:hypothetical protein
MVQKYSGEPPEKYRTCSNLMGRSGITAFMKSIPPEVEGFAENIFNGKSSTIASFQKRINDFERSNDFQ